MHTYVRYRYIHIDIMENKESNKTREREAGFLAGPE
jgi:hypothetical protein